MTFAVNVNGGGTRRLKTRAPIYCGEQFRKIHHQMKISKIITSKSYTAISVFFFIVGSFLFRQ